jgi:hypothetical protein
LKVWNVIVEFSDWDLVDVIEQKKGRGFGVRGGGGVSSRLGRAELSMTSTLALFDCSNLSAILEKH